MPLKSSSSDSTKPARASMLDVHLAAVRELNGRAAWEETLVPRPLTVEFAAYAESLRELEVRGVAPHELAARPGIEHRQRVVGPETTDLPPDTAQTADEAMKRLEDLPHILGSAVLERRVTLSLDECQAAVRADLAAFRADIETLTGCRMPGRMLLVRVVPYSPEPPTAGFLVPRRPWRGAFVGANHYDRSAILQAALALQMEALLRTVRAPDSLRSQIAQLVPGDSPYGQRLRSVLRRIVVGLSAAHLARRRAPEMADLNQMFGLDLRYPRLYPLVAGAWTQYLEGRCNRAAALAALAAELGAATPRWFVDQVDAASLAADFYLLESAASKGDLGARQALAGWEPVLAEEFARHLVTALGAELGHTARIRPDRVPPEQRWFLEQLGPANPMLSWPLVYEVHGARALALAEQVFLGPGIEFGGDAWAPLARLLQLYVDGSISPRIFIDQCFTLEHNNGSVFDKFFDTFNLATVLDAQAAADLDTLALHASRAVSALSGRATGPPIRPAADRSGLRGEPLGVGCGYAGEDLPESDAELAREAAENSTLAHRGGLRRRAPVTPPTTREVVVLTSAGTVRIRLFPDRAPRNVRNFLDLAAGTRTWVDPETAEPRTEPFYQGVRFHRIIPGLVVQAGDRSGTGYGGPGYRVPDDPNGRAPFDRPYLMAMASLGPNANGSQFFITLAPLPHLDHQYMIIGEVQAGDEESVRTLAAMVDRELGDQPGTVITAIEASEPFAP